MLYCPLLDVWKYARRGSTWYWSIRADPARGLEGSFQQYLVVKSHNSFATVQEMRCASQHYCDEKIDDEMALYR